MFRMSWFDLILTQPIFNLLAFIFAFVADFGVAIIILTIIVRMILWPLVKKQLHQTKIMRKIQPELKKIKARANGDRMVESQLMMELYREKGVKPMSNILVLVIQLPVFIALIRVVQIFSATYQKMNHVSPEQFIYPFLNGFHIFANTSTLLHNGATHLFGLVDLTKTAGNYAPALVLAVLAAIFQFWQSKQLMPKASDQRKLRDLFREANSGKQVDQSEMMAATSNKMVYFFPFMTFVIALGLPAAVVLYYAVTSAVAVVQQGILLRDDDVEMLAEADKKTPRHRTAKEAEIVVRPKSPAKKSESKNDSGATVVRRIKAK